MSKCPECDTENPYVYIGAISVECTNIACRHFNDEAHTRWLAIAPDRAELERLYSDYLDYMTKTNQEEDIGD
jgi:hypothetical protein